MGPRLSLQPNAGVVGAGEAYGGRVSMPRPSWARGADGVRFLHVGGVGAWGWHGHTVAPAFTLEILIRLDLYSAFMDPHLLFSVYQSQGYTHLNTSSLKAFLFSCRRSGSLHIEKLSLAQHEVRDSVAYAASSNVVQRFCLS